MIDAHEAPPARQHFELRFALLVTSVCFALALWNVTAHEMWRDEWRWWQLALASPTFAEMRRNMQFEGAPGLWYGLLWCLSRLTANSLAMQVTHALIAAGTVFLFTLKAPFSRAVRLLFPFGYFTFFEYATISRNYALVFLLVIASTAVIAGPRLRPVLLSVLLGLLTQASIWGAGLAGILLLAALVQEWLRSPEPRRICRAFAWPAVVVGAGCLVCVLASLPGPGSSFIARWPDDISLKDKLMTTVAGIWNGWFPLPRPTRHFWNTNLLDDHLNARFYASLVLFVVAALSLARRPAALMLLTGGTAGLMSFTLLQFVGATRHQGHLYMVLIAACWIAARSPRREAPRILARPSAWLEPRLDRLLAVFLGVQAISGIACAVADHRLPFSASRQIAEYLRREWPDDVLIVGYDDYGLSPVAAILDRPIFSPETDGISKNFSQDDRARRKVTIERLAEQVERLRREADRPVLIVLTPRRKTDLDDWTREHDLAVPWQLLVTFENSTVEDEGVTIFLALPPEPPRARAANMIGGLVLPVLERAPDVSPDSGDK